MRRIFFSLLITGISLMTAAAHSAVAPSGGAAPIPWKQCLSQPAEWYGGEEAARIADNVLLYQRDTGGWNKNVDMAAPLTEKETAELLRQKKDADSTIDNGATFTQMAFLARVYRAGKAKRFRQAFLKGLDYLLAAQYDNGGWPQFFPLRTGYYARITFNDDAMIGVLRLLRDIASREATYAFVDEGRRLRAEKAVEKGIACILRCQIVVDGKQRTAWCAQHDEKTFAPAPARAYEKVSLSGNETVGIARFLMGIERPTPAVIASVQAAVAWLETARLTGIRYEKKPDPATERGWDQVVVADPTAPSLWARFYEIGTNRPIFSGRDGVIKYRLSEIEYERRTGYQWYNRLAAPLLKDEYPAWRRKWAVP